MANYFKILLVFSLFFNPLISAEYKATPINYKSFLKKLEPGDVLTFGEGIYKGNLQLDDLHGEEGALIILQGIEGKTTFTATDDENTINFINCSYIHLRNFKLDGNHLKVDGIKM